MVVQAQAGKVVGSLQVGDRVAYWGNTTTRRTPFNGGYAEYLTKHESSFVSYPESVSFQTAVPTELLSCLTSAPAAYWPCRL